MPISPTLPAPAARAMYIEADMATGELAAMVANEAGSDVMQTLDFPLVDQRGNRLIDCSTTQCTGSVVFDRTRMLHAKAVLWPGPKMIGCDALVTSPRSHVTFTSNSPFTCGP